MIQIYKYHMLLNQNMINKDVYIIHNQQMNFHHQNILIHIYNQVLHCFYLFLQHIQYMCFHQNIQNIIQDILHIIYQNLHNSHLYSDSQENHQHQLLLHILYINLQLNLYILYMDVNIIDNPYLCHYQNIHLSINKKDNFIYLQQIHIQYINQYW